MGETGTGRQGQKENQTKERQGRQISSDTEQGGISNEKKYFTKQFDDLYFGQQILVYPCAYN